MTINLKGASLDYATEPSPFDALVVALADARVKGQRVERIEVSTEFRHTLCAALCCMADVKWQPLVSAIVLASDPDGTFLGHPLLHVAELPAPGWRVVT